MATTSNVLTARFQFEIRYSHILDFHETYKGTIAPYLKLSESFQFIGQGTFDEGIKLLFPKEAYSIDFRWDRLIFYSEGDLSRFRKKTSAIKIVFDILSNLTKTPSFGKITSYIAGIQGVQIIKDSENKINVSDFKGKYLKCDIDKLIESTTLFDIAIVLNCIIGEKKELSITTGPFDCTRDIKSRDLMPFKSAELKEIETSNGIMVDIKVVDRVNAVDHEKFVGVIDIADEYYKKL